ncbi:MAG: thermonuclease family protein [Verrucomicrobiia bacterium]|jgi:endonuclease YncB( thermonuclease family)
MASRSGSRIERRQTGKSRLALVASLLLTTFCLARLACATEEWQTLKDCILIPNHANDGDSFHVRHDGKEYIFRLYFIDTPETENEFPDRVANQAKYFHIPVANVLAIGREAARFTAQELNGRFTVVTRWQGARGQSKLPRHYALVEINGKDLSEELVTEGLARVFGVRANRPGAPPAKQVIAKLKQLERVAKLNHRGAWMFSR